MQEFLDILRSNAIYIKLEANSEFGGAVDIESLTKALQSLNQSYKNFIKADIQKQFDQKKSEVFNKELKNLAEESQLLIVDLDFASFGAGISPNIVTLKNEYFVFKNVLEVKKRTFTDYKSDVFFSDYNDPAFVKRITEKFTPEERAGIYRPIMDNIISQRKFRFTYGKSKSEKKELLKLPIKQTTIDQLIPNVSRKISSDEEMYLIYATSSDEVDLFGKKPKLGKMLAVEKLEEPTYPYQTQQIKFEENNIILTSLLSAHVSFEEGLFHISYPDLGINVWGDTREDAEEAFNFTFYSLISTIYHETNSSLTDKALKVKNKLLQLVKAIKN